jgi:hypothetical protein
MRRDWYTDGHEGIIGAFLENTMSLKMEISMTSGCLKETFAAKLAR